MSEDLNAENIVDNWERIKKLEAKVAELEHNMIFLLDLGIEKHIADHNRELHEREMSLDFKNSAGLSRAGIDY